MERLDLKTLSVIGESEARKLGLVAKSVEGKMGDASGQGLTNLQITLVADRLSLTLGTKLENRMVLR